MAEFLNNNIKHLRTSRKISQQTLADKVGIDRSTISRIENNEIETTIDNAIKIADVLNVPISSLIGKDLTVDENPIGEYELVDNENLSSVDKVLFSKAKMLNDEEKQAIINVMDAIHKDIDKELDNK